LFFLINSLCCSVLWYLFFLLSFLSLLNLLLCAMSLFWGIYRGLSSFPSPHLFYW
jgi:hypothetical protein